MEYLIYQSSLEMENTCLTEEKLEEVSKKLEELRKEEADLERQIYEELEAEEY